MTIAEYYRRIASIDREALIRDVFDEVKPEIIKYNKEQLSKGLDSKNESLGDYGGYYREYRGELGLQVDHVDLKVTGKFYETIYARLEGEEIEIFSSDVASKVQAIIYGGEGVREGGFGENIFGLIDENKNKINKIANKKIVEIINDILSL